jgi:hypothetical protein
MCIFHKGDKNYSVIPVFRHCAAAPFCRFLIPQIHHGSRPSPFVTLIRVVADSERRNDKGCENTAELIAKFVHILRDSLIPGEKISL